MAPSSAQLGTSSAAQLPSSSSLPQANAHTPLQFCELLRAYWEDRSIGSLVPVPTEETSKKKKGKGRAISSLQSAAFDNINGQQPQLQRKQLIREAKSFYIKVDLAASPSCVKHINLLQSDTSLRQEVEKLVSLAQTSSAHTATAPKPRKDSGNSTPSLSGSPAKLNFRNAQQLLHAEARAETLERRIYLRVLLSRTILRYIEKYTGCKYLYEGDKVVHYKERTNAYSRKKKARCVFYYQCASGEYEESPCAGTMRLVVDLDLGDVLIHDENQRTDQQHEEENEMSLDESEPSDVEEQPAQKASKTRQNGILPRTPVTRTYGSRSRYPSLLSSISLSSRSTRLNDTSRASHPSTSLSSSTSTLPPFVVALRLTHIKRHQEPYSILRANYKESRLQGQAKLDKIGQKMIVLQEEFERLRRLQEDKDDLYERGVDRLWNKIKRAITPSTSDSEESDEDNTSEAEDQSVADGETAVDQEDAAQISETTEMEEDSPNESSKDWTANEEEVIISSDTIRTRSKRDKINQELGENSSQVEEVSQLSKPIESEPLPRTSRSAKVIAVRDVESVSSSSEDEEVQQQPTTKPSRTLRSKAKLVRDVRSTSPSNDKTDYSEPEPPVSASAKRIRNSEKEMDVGRSAGGSRIAGSGTSSGIARATGSRPTAIRGGGRRRRGK